jgi:hypothetical protein
MFVESCKHIVSLGRGIASRLLAITIALSFFAIWVPIVTASWDKSSVMACCIGKEAGHCDSGLTTHKALLPPPEPMCGLTPGSLDAITIVAGTYPKSHHTRRNAESSSSLASAESHAGVDLQTVAETKSAESPSLSKPCPMSCGACTTTASRLQKRQKDFVKARMFHTPGPRGMLRFENPSRVFPSNELWTSITPRGPPDTSLLTPLKALYFT